MQLADLDRSKVYSYADYYSWTFDNRVELIKGKIFDLPSSPGTIHQILSGRISFAIGSFLEGKNAEVFFAPFDVRLPQDSLEDKDIFTVVQPDISVFCNKSKLDERGGIGAPDIVVEILAPGELMKELKDKFLLYEESGVKEYWIVFPAIEIILKYELVGNNYQARRPLTIGDEIATGILPGFILSLDEIFEKDELMIRLYKMTYGQTS